MNSGEATSGIVQVFGRRQWRALPRADAAFLGFLRDCDSRSSGLSTLAIMPVATRV